VTVKIKYNIDDPNFVKDSHALSTRKAQEIKLRNTEEQVRDALLNSVWCGGLKEAYLAVKYIITYANQAEVGKKLASPLKKKETQEAMEKMMIEGLFDKMEVLGVPLYRLLPVVEEVKRCRS